MDLYHFATLQGCRYVVCTVPKSLFEPPKKLKLLIFIKNMQYTNMHRMLYRFSKFEDLEKLKQSSVSHNSICTSCRRFHRHPLWVTSTNQSPTGKLYSPRITSATTDSQVAHLGTWQDVSCSCTQNDSGYQLRFLTWHTVSGCPKRRHHFTANTWPSPCPCQLQKFYYAILL
jgi:hypothetical protein